VVRSAAETERRARAARDSLNDATRAELAEVRRSLRTGCRDDATNVLCGCVDRTNEADLRVCLADALEQESRVESARCEPLINRFNVRFRQVSVGRWTATMSGVGPCAYVTTIVLEATRDRVPVWTYRQVRIPPNAIECEPVLDAAPSEHSSRDAFAPSDLGCRGISAPMFL